MFRFSDSKNMWLACGLLTLAVGCGKEKQQPQAAASEPKAIAAQATEPLVAEVPKVQENPTPEDPDSQTNSAESKPVDSETSSAENSAHETPVVSSDEAPVVDEPAPIEPAPIEPASTDEAPINPRPVLDVAPMRVLLPSAAGGLLVDLDIRIDDVALETVFNQFIEKTIADSDTDKSKTASWDELLDHVATDTERFGRNAANNNGQRRNIVQLHDRNRNGFADADEVAHYLFRSPNFSKPFRLQGTNYFRDRQSQSRVFAALDRDGNGSLEPGEIDIATESLMRIDRNTDQRLDVSEIIAPTAPGNMNARNMNAGNMTSAWNNRRISRDGSVATDMYGNLDWTMAAYSLSGMIGKRPFSMATNPFADLDENEDGSISTNEAKTLRDAESDLVIRVDLSSTHSDPKLTVIWADSDLQNSVQTCKSDRTVAYDSDTLRLCVQIADRPIGNNRLPPEAFAMLDANNDGFLEESEIPAPFLQQYSFEDFDANNDDKLTIDEIREGMQPKSPIWSVQVRGRAAEFPDAVFALLDQDNDLALNTREMQSAANRLRDQATNGKVNSGDIPDTLMVQLVRGDPMQRGALFAFQGQEQSADSFADAPLWAKSMDANGDGDISMIEFPGKQEIFDKLDVNKDGFIAIDELSTQ